MPLACFRRMIRSGHFAWLLALVLWLPAAQWAAASHALLHLQSASQPSPDNDNDRPAHLAAACGTCLVAAGLGCAAPPSNPQATLLPRPPVAQPLAPAALVVALAPPASYRSRAPPLTHA
jgi:hypothetical protein